MLGVDELATAIREALASAGFPDREPAFERPRNRDHGDWATNVALTLAKPVGRPPRDVAGAIVERLSGVPGIAKVEVAGPGFINFHLATDARADVLRAAAAAGERWGRGVEPGSAGRANVEFVSANPTGPLHVGHARWMAAGDAIVNLLAATGWQVVREYYLNDAGAQMAVFGRSVQAAMRGEPAPEDGYKGAYVQELAREVLAAGVDADDVEAVTEDAYQRMLAQIRGTMERLGIAIDVWFSERTLHVEGRVAEVVDRLRAAGHAYESEGATFLATTRFGDDKDRVLVRSNGEPTYFAADCAYMADKVGRGFGKAIYLLGADHHGYVQRLHAIAAAEGVPDGVVEVLVGQMVNLLRDGEPVRMSKRSGDLITLDEVLDEIGADAARYTFLRSTLDVNIDVDLGKVVREERDNPVHYINYSYARLSGIMRTAQERGVDPGSIDDAPLHLLEHEREEDLVRRIAAFPERVALAAEERAPHRVARYAEDLAEAFHRFYEACQVVGPDPDLTRARWWLCAVARQTFANALALLGVTPRERM